MTFLDWSLELIRPKTALGWVCQAGTVAEWRNKGEFKYRIGEGHPPPPQSPFFPGVHQARLGASPFLLTLVGALFASFLVLSFLLFDSDRLLSCSGHTATCCPRQLLKLFLLSNFPNV